jgi:hypothetical protein
MGGPIRVVIDRIHGRSENPYFSGGWKGGFE